MDLKIFEILNAERASPHFLNIAKKTTDDSSLGSIRNAKGEIMSKIELNEYLTNYYLSLYRSDPAVEGEISDFLGEEILNHPMVKGSILTSNEKDVLDRNLECNELDKALDEANMKSAPGVDGFSYKFIKEFWQLYRDPLHKCAIESLENQTLPESFLTAHIKLIPKKGDLCKIGNWRPISLLSNFYKILSRAINNRLKVVSDRILSRAQKGFSQSRVIQESIINILETIDYCKRQNISGALISIDQSKAFDSVSHSYMSKVYQFYGFGPRIQNWLKSIGTGRTASIIMGPGEVSSQFKLDKGHAQGDSPSPLLYNFAAQILLFKIELDPGIKKIKPPGTLPGPIKCADPFLHESNRETGNCDCFADDNSVITYLYADSLQSIKIILDNFRTLSGLSTNYEKTAIMRIGNVGTRLPDLMQNLGFSYVDKIKLLGFTITNGDNLANLNFEPVTEKVTNLIKFWERFYLSLSGRITVYKTLLLPQINYVASVLMPSEYTLTNLSLIMENFVCKGFNIAKDRLYRKPQDGGLGLFNLELFINALQCTWIKRTHSCCNDNWKYDLLQATEFNLEYVYRIHEPYDVGNTILGILNSFRKFVKCFSKVNQNFRKTCIYESDMFGYGRNLHLKFDNEFFGPEIMSNYGEKIHNLK